MHFTASAHVVHASKEPAWFESLVFSSSPVTPVCGKWKVKKVEHKMPPSSCIHSKHDAISFLTQSEAGKAGKGLGSAQGLFTNTGSSESKLDCTIMIASAAATFSAAAPAPAPALLLLKSTECRVWGRVTASEHYSFVTRYTLRAPINQLHSLRRQESTRASRNS